MIISFLTVLIYNKSNILLRDFREIVSNMKIKKKYYGFLFALLVSIIMSLIMSFALTLINVGWQPHFFMIWLKAFGISFAVALPVSLIVVPLIRKLLDKIID